MRARRRPPVSRTRVRLVLVGVCVVFVLIAGRLAQIDLIGLPGVGAAWRGETTRSVALPVLRGSILSRGGQVLAVSMPGREVVADDFQITDPSGEAAQLSPLLGIPAQRLAGMLSLRSGFVVLAPYLARSDASRVAGLHAAGVSELPTSRRVYPDGALAGDIVGQLHSDGAGASGLEYRYNQLLSGRPGHQVTLVGVDGQVLPGGVLHDQPAQPGSGLELTLSRTLQYRTEQVLAAQIAATNARWGSAVILDSATGAILAMANLQAGPGGKAVEAADNLAVTKVFEPGSVMKLATFSGALTDGLITPTTALDVPDHLDVDGSMFHDAETHPTETLTAAQILAQSSNVGTIEIAQRLGREQLYRFLTRYGFGQPTGLGFPGASPGIVNPPDRWSGTALAATAIGQDEAVNVLQLADAYNTIAEGGRFVPPHLVRAVIGPHGTAHPVPAGPTRRVVSPAVAAQMTSMLENVISPQGTAPAAALPAWTVAGKTGTAQIPLSGRSGYQPGAYMAVFAGFAPARHPAVTAVVVLDRPTPVYGGSVAAPVFAQIASDALTQLGVAASPGRLSAPVDFPTGPGISTGLPVAAG